MSRKIEIRSMCTNDVAANEAERDVGQNRESHFDSNRVHLFLEGPIRHIRHERDEEDNRRDRSSQ